MGKGIVKLGEGQWAVKDGNLLAAKETNGRFKNTEFTVSRGTRASYVGRDGLIKESNLQDVNLVNNGDFSELGSELVTNGDFSNGTTDWEGEGFSQITVGTYQGRNNVAKININNTATISRIRQPFTYVNGTTYKIVVNVYLESGSFRVDTSDTFVSGDFLSTTSTGSWQTLTAYFTAISSGSNYIWLRSLLEVSEFYVDNVSVKEVDPNDYWSTTSTVTVKDGFANITSDSSYQYLRQLNIVEVGKSYKLTYEITRQGSGILKSSSLGLNSIPSIVGTHTVYGVSLQTYIVIDRAGSCDIDITNISIQEVKTDTPRIDFTDNTDGHLLLEPQSTNLITYSEDFSEWSLSNATVEGGYLAPDGSNNAYKVSGTVGNSSIYLGGVNATDTRTIWARTVSGTGQAQLCSYFGNTNNLKTITNEWQRFEVNGTTTATGAANFYAIDFRGSTDLSEIIIWGAQSEVLSYPTSYIPTNGSTVTRDAETCTGAGSSADFNSEEGVLYAEIAALTDDLSNRFISLTDGTDSNSVTIYYGGVSNRIRYEVKSSSAVQANVVTTSYDITNYNKIAVKYKANDFALWVNGTNVAQDANGLTPVGLNDLSFDRASILDFYGKVKAIKVYKEALDDTDLQNLTS